MFDAVLSLFSIPYSKRHNKYKVATFLDQLTKDSLRSCIRSDLLEGRDGYIPELHRALQKNNKFRHLFDKFAVCRSPGADNVWTEKQFARFIASRLGNSDAAAVLWRCFYRSPTYPFADPYDQRREQQVDFDGWIHAITSLVTSSRTSRFDKDLCWDEFLSLAVPSDQPVLNEIDEWHPPSLLDKVTRLARCKLPLGMKFVRPPDAEIRPRVQKLIDEDYVDPKVGDLEISYRDMLALLSAILQVVKDNTRNRQFDEDQHWSSPSIDMNGDVRLALAQGILDVSEISKDESVSFSSYLTFCQRFGWEWGHQPFAFTWSFNMELRQLWRALFFIQENHNADSSRQTHPPALILQAVHFLYPFPQGSGRELLTLRQSVLECSTKLEPSLSRSDVLAALTWPFGPKFVIIHGTMATDSQASSESFQDCEKRSADQQPAFLALLLSSPLWCIFKTGERRDFFVGETHMLFELVPRPRILWYATRDTMYADLVDTSVDGEISFRAPGTDPTTKTAQFPGLSLNFITGRATLSSSPVEKEGEMTGYVELPVGSHRGPPKTVDNLQPWSTTVRMKKIEVYSGTGVFLELLVKNANDDDSDQ